MKKLIESVGSKMVSSVSKNNDFILSDPSATSSKAVKAKELGVTYPTDKSGGLSQPYASERREVQTNPVGKSTKILPS